MTKMELAHLPKDTKVIVWDNGEDKEIYGVARYLSHFNENGEIYVFCEGRTSWSDYGYGSIETWDNFEVVNN